MASTVRCSNSEYILHEFFLISHHLQIFNALKISLLYLLRHPPWLITVTYHQQYTFCVSVKDAVVCTRFRVCVPHSAPTWAQRRHRQLLSFTLISKPGLQGQNIAICLLGFLKFMSPCLQKHQLLPLCCMLPVLDCVRAYGRGQVHASHQLLFHHPPFHFFLLLDGFHFPGMGVFLFLSFGLLTLKLRV